MSGDFEDFFRTSYPRLMARAVLMCGNREDAEDAVAQAFADVARNWERAGSYQSPEAYLHVTMTRKVFRLLRQRRKQEVAALELPVSPYATPHEEFAAKEVLAAVASLPTMQRAVVVLCCLDGKTQKEAAGILRIMRGTVAAHLFKARETLREKLGLDVPVPDDRLTANRDRVTQALRSADQWLAEGFAADLPTRDRIRAAVDEVRPRRRLWGRA